MGGSNTIDATFTAHFDIYRHYFFDILLHSERKDLLYVLQEEKTIFVAISTKAIKIILNAYITR